MRIYANAYELMSETGRNLWEMGAEVRPTHYQNKDISGNENFYTKELICEQYCLTKLPDPDCLFIYTNAREWADQEFKERIEFPPCNPGNAWELRKEVWEEFLVGNIHKYFDYTYAERFNYITRDDRFTALETVIVGLKNDPDTRKAILPVFNIDDTTYWDGSKRIPCSMYYDFLIRKNVKGEPVLNICYHQRSSDFITHFGNDVYLAWKLMEFIAKEVEVKPGYLYHTIDSLHAYKKDWVKLKTSVSEML